LITINPPLSIWIEGDCKRLFLPTLLKIRHVKKLITFRSPLSFLKKDLTQMQTYGGLKITILVLLFILILRLILKGWQKVAVSRKGEKFKFLLTKLPFSHDVTWRDVRYSILVVIDSIISIIILIWVLDKLF